MSLHNIASVVPFIHFNNSWDISSTVFLLGATLFLKQYRIFVSAIWLQWLQVITNGRPWYYLERTIQAVRYCFRYALEKIQVLKSRLNKNKTIKGFCLGLNECGIKGFCSLQRWWKNDGYSLSHKEANFELTVLFKSYDITTVNKIFVEQYFIIRCLVSITVAVGFLVQKFWSLP